MCLCRYNAGNDVVSYTTNNGFTTIEFTGDSTVAIGTTQDFSGASNSQLRWEININVRPRKICRIEHCTGFAGELSQHCYIATLFRFDTFIFNYIVDLAYRLDINIQIRPRKLYIIIK